MKFKYECQKKTHEEGGLTTEAAQEVVKLFQILLSLTQLGSLNCLIFLSYTKSSTYSSKTTASRTCAKYGTRTRLSGRIGVFQNCSTTTTFG